MAEGPNFSPFQAASQRKDALHSTWVINFHVCCWAAAARRDLWDLAAAAHDEGTQGSPLCSETTTLTEEAIGNHSLLDNSNYVGDPH